MALSIISFSGKGLYHLVGDNSPGTYTEPFLRSNRNKMLSYVERRLINNPFVIKTLISKLHKPDCYGLVSFFIL
jgi:hypothetical protein